MSPILESIGSVKGYGWGALPAGGSFESIQTITVGTTSQASVTFSSIPATYTHLQLRISNRGGGSTVQLNSDTTSNYKRHYLYTDGTSVLAGTGGAADGMSLLSYSTTANVLAANILDILD